MHAAATFAIDNWEQDALDDEPGAPLARARVAKTFSGDLEATSVANILLAGDPADEAARAYVGVERVTGVLRGRAGSFVLVHSAVAAGDASHVAWTILPASGTGELAGIAGSAQISIGEDGGHAIRLDYELSDI
jgi:hypothetical protein